MTNFADGHNALDVVVVDPTTGVAVRPAPGGGANATGNTITKLSAAAGTNATSLKATAGNLYSALAHNTAAYVVFIKYYNKASAPTVGTDVPLYTIAVPIGQTMMFEPTLSKRFTLGIAMAITKFAGDADATAVVAGDVLVTTEFA